MERIYIIEGLTVAFRTYDEAKGFLKAYNQKYAIDVNELDKYIYADAIKPRYLCTFEEGDRV